MRNKGGPQSDRTCKAQALDVEYHKATSVKLQGSLQITKSPKPGAPTFIPYVP